MVHCVKRMLMVVMKSPVCSCQVPCLPAANSPNVSETGRGFGEPHRRLTLSQLPLPVCAEPTATPRCSSGQNGNTGVSVIPTTSHNSQLLFNAGGRSTL